MNLQRKVDVQASLDVQAFLDEQRFSRFHILLFVLCFLIIALDGMDTGAMGYIAPSLIQDWQLSRAALGPVLSATLVGIGIGAMVVSPIADRIGRKRVLIGAVFAFGVCSVAAAFAQSLEMLAALRLLTGIGLGAAVPNTVALMAEYAPTRIRGTVVNAMLVGNIESNQWVVRHAAEDKGRSLEAFYAEMGKRIPLGRVGTAQEFANMALFLASDAGSYITGTAINIDGGLSPVV